HINGDNNINNINISGVSNGFVSMNVDGHVKEHIKDNELNENIRILTISGRAFVSPMLHVSSLNVLANHNTAISNVNEDYLFYLMSKGIDKNAATKLVEDSYLYGLFKNEEFINLIK
ncbi:MAG: SufD family Fe-S cluster assembly protein, partial [Bacilli bacterium]|nr:SufD family Fe-S cluster assembly protein [Bacilli bacterium]